MHTHFLILQLSNLTPHFQIKSAQIWSRQVSSKQYPGFKEIGDNVMFVLSSLATFHLSNWPTSIGKLVVVTEMNKEKPYNRQHLSSTLYSQQGSWAAVKAPSVKVSKVCQKLCDAQNGAGGFYQEDILRFLPLFMQRLRKTWQRDKRLHNRA